jgi:hypothetical protein
VHWLLKGKEGISDGIADSSPSSFVDLPLPA